jgi:hypothetical protein
VDKIVRKAEFERAGKLKVKARKLKVEKEFPHLFANQFNMQKLQHIADELEIIEAMQALTEDLYNDYQNCLNRLDAKNLESFKDLETIGKDNRIERYTFLHTELSRLMREEIQLK